MIVGIGCDLVQVCRVERIWARYGETFLNRFFTSAEKKRALSSHSVGVFLSGRLAAKEAFSKAVGTGFGSCLSWKDISVETLPSGAPTLLCSRAINGVSGKFNKVHVTIAHDAGFAMAYVVVEYAGRGV